MTNKEIIKHNLRQLLNVNTNDEIIVVKKNDKVIAFKIYEDYEKRIKNTYDELWEICDDRVAIRTTAKVDNEVLVDGFDINDLLYIESMTSNLKLKIKDIYWGVENIK